ncbi:MAG: IS110 family transposase [Actinobacteria bacterium]|nr:IS110 family transposase [Actinomycetota bacterium]
MSLTPATASARVPARVCAGIDWASVDHAVCILDVDGSVLERFFVVHDAAGLKTLVRRLLKAGVDEVGIERGDGPVVDALLQAELTVLVIAPGQVKNLRSRYGSAGNKDDRFDAYVLADVVRTDRARLRPLVRDSAATTAMRTTVRARRDLVEHRVAAANQLRAHLQLVFPAAAGLFAAIDTAISLSFLRRFTTQTQADWLSVKRLATWLSSVGYSGRTDPAVLHARLLDAPRGTVGPDAQVHAATTSAYVALLRILNTEIAALEDNLTAQLKTHPDTHIYASLPRVKTLRTARLLAEIGDARGKFPTADSLAALAGVAPSTRQSGKVKAVTFRWGCNKQLRDALCDFAGDSRHDNAWAADLYDRAIARGHDHPHAVRILGRAWAHIIWRCWHDNLSYDPTQHQALRALLNSTTEKAA